MRATKRTAACQTVTSGAVSSDLLDIQHFSYGTLNGISSGSWWLSPNTQVQTGWCGGAQRDNLSIHRVFFRVTHGRHMYIHQPLHHSQPDVCDVWMSEILTGSHCVTHTRNAHTHRQFSDYWQVMTMYSFLRKRNCVYNRVYNLSLYPF